MTANLKAFLDLIALSEGTLGKGDNGYNVIVGGELFHNYSDHPRKKVFIRRINNYSTAAGKYQILERLFDFYKKAMQLPDFGPASQDRIAARLISECRAMADIEAGRIKEAIIKCKSRWASFPGAGYGQHENSMVILVNRFEDLRSNSFNNAVNVTKNVTT